MESVHQTEGSGDVIKIILICMGIYVIGIYVSEGIIQMIERMKK